MLSSTNATTRKDRLMYSRSHLNYLLFPCTWVALLIASFLFCTPLIISLFTRSYDTCSYESTFPSYILLLALLSSIYCLNFSPMILTNYSILMLYILFCSKCFPLLILASNLSHCSTGCWQCSRLCSTLLQFVSG